ncbi:MAG: RNA polymerase sigma factor [Phycisphaerales bacterium JB043]
MDDRSDEELVDAYRAGETNAFRVLIERYQDDLMRFLYRFMGSRELAEDVFQEAFLQIHVSIDTFDVTKRFKPWLFTIAANKGRDQHRKKNRRSTLELSANVGEEDGPAFVDLMEVDVPAPSDALDAHEQDRIVQQIVDSLPDLHREILLLAYFQRLSYVQMADQLGIPLGTVKSRLHAAVARFAQAWQQHLDESE